MEPKYAKGTNVVLAAIPAEGIHEEHATIIDYEGDGMYMVCVHDEFKTDVSDDGLRELHESQIVGELKVKFGEHMSFELEVKDQPAVPPLLEELKRREFPPQMLEALRHQFYDIEKVNELAPEDANDTGTWLVNTNEVMAEISWCEYGGSVTYTVQRDGTMEADI